MRVGHGGVAHHALFFGQLLVEQQGILPVERGRRGHAGTPV
ncbi:Uncharacterised protein [Bordetella pertussis]|nr:Uncharacterised protein [Bordetella pertussis]